MFSSHATRTGPGRSTSNVPIIPKNQAGAKLAKKINMGMCGLRNGVGLAGRLALENKLGEKMRNHRKIANKLKAARRRK